MPRIPNLESVSNAEINKILSIQEVADRIYRAALAHQDQILGYRQPPEVRRSQCNRCYYSAVECVRGSEYAPDESGQCARFSDYEY